MVSFVSSYFSWLRNKAPSGPVEKYPEVGEGFRSESQGIYIIGDLTGVPLLKLASESGALVWKSILKDQLGKPNSDVYDAIVVGGGPAGISAGIEGKKLGKKVLVLEANATFQTIRSYPKGKPIFAEPEGIETLSSLPIQNGTKESLLEELQTALKTFPISIQEGERVTDIKRTSGGESRFVVFTESKKSFATNNIVIAVGKSGDPQKLSIPGADAPHVTYRLIDPADFKDQQTLVIGGGDSALEASIALAGVARKVTLSYRGKELARPKQDNQEKFFELVEAGRIRFLPETNLKEIKQNHVLIDKKSGDKQSTLKLEADSVLVLIGTKPPLVFLEKMGLSVAGKILLRHWLGMVSFLGFASLAYFGKTSFYGNEWYSFVSLFGLVACVGGFIGWIWLLLGEKGFQIPKGWQLFRNLYLFLAFAYFSFIYFSAQYFGVLWAGKYPSFHYTFLYSLTILVFGIRRILVKPTTYIKWQTASLILVQWVPLFLLPEVILPFLGSSNLLGEANGFVRTQMFPNESYWFAYRLILAWPLNMGALYDGSLTSFWLIYGLALSFGVIPILVFRYGKGAYCGWICSCGGLAETLGDEHRTKMPHSRFAYKIEHSGQWILLLAFILTALKFTSFAWVADSVKWVYDLSVDVVLAGVIGVGLYFLFSGRVWCRMFCPLAGLMHIYARFSQFRIFAEKKKCISCNICTKVCHQGIDVMSYANIGRPMDSVQCVRCSACVSQCPTGVLSFGRQTTSGVVKDSISAVLSQNLAR